MFDMKMKCPAVILCMAVATAFLIMGCGGGEGGGQVEVCFQEIDYWLADNPPLNSTSYIDTYTLNGFDVLVWEDGVFLGTISESDFDSYSGTMDITADSIYQDITLELLGSTETASIAASYSASWSDTHTGTFTISDIAGDYNVDVSISGDILITDIGQICEMVDEEAMSTSLFYEIEVPTVGTVLHGLSDY
jgi:hypothetical protein